LGFDNRRKNVESMRSIGNIGDERHREASLA